LNTYLYSDEEVQVFSHGFSSRGTCRIFFKLLLKDYVPWQKARLENIISTSNLRYARGVWDKLKNTPSTKRRSALISSKVKTRSILSLGGYASHIQAGFLTHESSSSSAFPSGCKVPNSGSMEETTHLQWPDRPGLAPGSLLTLQQGHPNAFLF